MIFGFRIREHVGNTSLNRQKLFTRRKTEPEKRSSIRQSGWSSGVSASRRYQTLRRLLIEELRKSDILGSLGDDQLGVLIPYTDPSVLTL